jgi:hypothetical protein
MSEAYKSNENISVFKEIIFLAEGDQPMIQDRSVMTREERDDLEKKITMYFMDVMQSDA